MMRFSIAVGIGRGRFVVIVKNFNRMTSIVAQNHVEAIAIVALAQFVNKMVLLVELVVFGRVKLQACLPGNFLHLGPAFFSRHIREDSTSDQQTNDYRYDNVKYPQGSLPISLHEFMSLTTPNLFVR